MNLFKVAILSTLFLGGSFLKLNAQTQLELSSGSLPSPANGATVTNQTATKLENTTGSTFVAYSPTITFMPLSQTNSMLQYQQLLLVQVQVLFMVQIQIAWVLQLFLNQYIIY